MRVALILFLGVLSLQAHAWTVVAAGIRGWQGSPLTVQYNFSDCPVPEADLIASLDRALSAWNQSQGTQMVLVRAEESVSTTVSEFGGGTAAQTPLILCDTAFSVNQSVDAEFVPAATRLSSSNGHLSYAGIVLNAEVGKAANISRLSLDQLSITLAHELGHVLGLGHTANTEALMYYSINGKTTMLLSQDDMDGLAFLYPRNEFSGGPFGCASAKRGSRTVDLGWLLALVFLPLLLGRWWVRSIRPEPRP